MFTKYSKPIAVIVCVCLLFFYKTMFMGKLPFPGDLLVSGYAPWNHESYGGYVPGAVPSKDQYFDVVRELYPWKTLVVSQIKKGIAPLWNPYNFSGSPLLANYQSQALYPLTFLYYLFPQDIAWTIMVILQPILGGVFLFLFATEIGISVPGAILAAILFNFSSFANVWIEFSTIWHVILWLPLLLYLIERSVKKGSLSRGEQFFFIFALFSSITGGHPQDFLNTFLFLCVYALLRRAPRSLLLPTIIPFFLAAPQLLPTIELFRHSARVAHDYQGIITNMLVQWWQLPLLAVTDFFGNPATKTNITGDYVGKTLSIGIVGFALAASAVRSLSSWHKKFFTGAAIGILILTVRTPISELLYRYPWPILSTGTPTRILFLLTLALSILAGFGFDAIRKDMTAAKKPFILLWIIMIALWIFSPIKKAMILPTVLLGAGTVTLLLAHYKKILILAFVPLAVIELFYGFIKFNPFVPRSFVIPENKLITKLKEYGGVDRFWGYGTAEVEANFATQTQLFSPDGTDPLNLSWYNRFVQSSRDGNIAMVFNRTTRSDAKIASGYGKDDLPSNEFRLRVMDMLGVKYILDRSENPQDEHTFAPDRFALAAKVDEWRIYKNLKAAPRFFVTTDVRAYTDIKNFEQQFFDPAFKPSQTVLVEQKDLLTLPKLDSVTHPSDLQLISYTPNTIVFKAKTDSQSLLFLSDTYDRGWTATVNDRPTQVVKTNFAFRGVIVPKGETTVIFTYQPRSFTTGIALSIIAALTTILYLII